MTSPTGGEGSEGQSGRDPEDDRYPGTPEQAGLKAHEVLEFYRKEVHFEFGLLGMRTSILVGCQSFLVVPFGILHSVSGFGLVVGIAVLLIAALGAWVAAVLWEPMSATHRTIDEWVMRCRVLYNRWPELAVLSISRDRLSGVETGIEKDADHVKSLAFSKQAPVIFLCFWAAAATVTVVRLVVASYQFGSLPDFMLGRLSGGGP